MAKSVVARQQGDDYQARWFWIQVCRLFEERSKVASVTYESEAPKSFDDVTVAYSSGRCDEEGNPLYADFYQVKFHVTQEGALTYESLMDPKFVNATSVSLLERGPIMRSANMPRTAWVVAF